MLLLTEGVRPFESLGVDVPMCWWWSCHGGSTVEIASARDPATMVLKSHESEYGCCGTLSLVRW